MFMSESLSLSLSLFFQQHIHSGILLLETSKVDSARDLGLFYWWSKNKATGNLELVCTWPLNHNDSGAVCIFTLNVYLHSTVSFLLFFDVNTY